MAFLAARLLGRRRWDFLGLVVSRVSIPGFLGCTKLLGDSELEVGKGGDR